NSLTMLRPGFKLVIVGLPHRPFVESRRQWRSTVTQPQSEPWIVECEIWVNRDQRLRPKLPCGEGRPCEPDSGALIAVHFDRTLRHPLPRCQILEMTAEAHQGESGDTEQPWPSWAVELLLRLRRHEDTYGIDIPYKCVQPAAITLIHRFMNFGATFVQVVVTR